MNSTSKAKTNKCWPSFGVNTGKIVQHQKIKVLLVELNDNARGAYNKNNQIKFTIAMSKSGFCGYISAYIYVAENSTNTHYL